MTAIAFGWPTDGEPRALERIDRDVDGRWLAVADLLAVEEHRRLVLLPLADDDDAVHRHGVEHVAHRVDRRLVGRVLVAAPDPAPGGERGRLGDADELEREVAVGGGRVGHRGHRNPHAPSHALGGLDADEVEAAREDCLASRRQSPSRNGCSLAPEDAAVVVEAVEVVGDPDGVDRDGMRPAPLGRLGDDGRELGQALDAAPARRARGWCVSVAAGSAEPAFRRIPAIRAWAYWT